MVFSKRNRKHLLRVSANVIGRVFMFPAMDNVKQQYDIKPDVSTGESLGKAEVVLVQSHFALDFPRPLTPGKYCNLIS